MAKAAADQTASAVGTEVSRFVQGNLDSEVIQVSSIDEVFAHPSCYASFPTDFYVIPTQTDWSLHWCNTFHCNGYDSLCHCLTLNHSIETAHYLSSDADAFYQAGSTWIHRVPGMPARSIATSREDKKWIWHAEGEPQSYENQTHYASRFIKKRFNHAVVNEYLDALGCNPNTEPFDLSNGVHHFWRTDDTPQIKREDYGYILERCRQQADSADAPDL